MIIFVMNAFQCIVKVLDSKSVTNGKIVLMFLSTHMNAHVCTIKFIYYCYYIGNDYKTFNNPF